MKSLPALPFGAYKNFFITGATKMVIAIEALNAVIYSTLELIHMIVFLYCKPARYKVLNSSFSFVCRRKHRQHRNDVCTKRDCLNANATKPEGNGD